jgi:hypothetical protein
MGAVEDKSGKAINVFVNAIYDNGISLFKNKLFKSDAQVLPARPETPNTRIVTIRFAASAGDAEALEHAMRSGCCELNLEGVKALD